VDEMVAFVAAELSARADPEAAAAMAKYMKTDMPFYGVKTPERNRIVREVVRRFPVASHRDYERAVTALWRLPHREEKYLAIDVARAYPAHIVFASVPLYRRMVTEGAWWDLVDGVAAGLIGKMALDEPDEMWPLLDQWVDDADLWLRRTAIIAQLRHKGATDEARLFRYCLARAHEREFFIRKAIGWALREYGKTAPEAVRRFVLDNCDVWSGLTYREATKHLGVPPR
jgi:3-methyladenine DNA glycosylase AlkD